MVRILTYPIRVVRRIHEFRTDCFFWRWSWTEWPQAILYGFGGRRAIGLRD